MINSPKYYLETTQLLGWSEDSSSDKERLLLIKQFSKGKKILDVGCGFGLYVDYLVSEGFDAYGVDFVKEFIEKANKTKKGKFIEAVAESLPFEDNEFDTTLFFNILEHGDDIKILKEAKRISKKRILVIVPRTVDKTLEQSGIIFRHYLDKSHLREYQEKDIKGLADKTGLKLMYLRAIHPLYNETIFLSLFDGLLFIKKIIRKIVFLILPKKNYPTEYFVVFEK